jgi:cation:H+ antiporter
MALRIGMSPFIVGMTVVAFATSAPELAVSLQAALAGVDDVAIGNVVGSNIANIGLILGICALIRPADIHSRMLRLDLPWLIFISVLLLAFLNDGHISRPAGIVFLCGLGLFLYWNIQIARREQAEDRLRIEAEVQAATEGVRGRLDLLLIAVGLFALVLGGAAFVRGGVSFAEALGVSPAVIALTVIAVGTSLPELATSIVAAPKGDADIAVGNIVGSNIFNVLGILGATALIAPIPVAPRFLTFDLPIMIAVSLGLTMLLLTRPVIGRGIGLVMVLGYVAFVWSAQG